MQFTIEQGGVQLHYDSQSVIYLVSNQLYHAKTIMIQVFTRSNIYLYMDKYYLKMFIVLIMHLIGVKSYSIFVLFCANENHKV